MTPWWWTPQQVVGPPAGFVRATVLLSWSPVPGASLYEYFVAQPGQSNAVARGITPGLFVQVPVPAVGGAATAYSGIVRACTGGPCAFGSDAYWGPWSNAAGGPGVTSFTVR